MRQFLHTVPAKPPLATGLVHRRVEITVEREVVSLHYQPGRDLLGHCEQCGREVAMLHAEAAAVVAGTSTREIYRLLDGNRLHFHETPGASVLICSESLKHVSCDGRIEDPTAGPTSENE